jgi:hypothetical protein
MSAVIARASPADARAGVSERLAATVAVINFPARDFIEVCLSSILAIIAEPERGEGHTEVPSHIVGKYCIPAPLNRPWLATAEFRLLPGVIT